MANAIPQRRILGVFGILWLVVILLNGSPCFGRPRQAPLEVVREQTGRAIRSSARGMTDFGLNREEKIFLSKIAQASQERDWPAACSAVNTYEGSGTPIYSAAMHAAFRCREYMLGAQIWEKCQANCKIIDLPGFTAAIRIFGKLGERTRVQEIWDDALKAHELDEVISAARITAAADAGDVEAAAQTLDEMASGNVSINELHINSAIRACWGWGQRQHKAAKYFFDLLEEFQIRPNVVLFTSLVGAYRESGLQELLSVYKQMKAFGVEPDPVFAETYLFSVLKGNKAENVRIERTLQQKPLERLKAARDALNDFKKAGVRLKRVCAAVDRELAAMNI